MNYLEKYYFLNGLWRISKVSTKERGAGAFLTEEPKQREGRRAGGRASNPLGLKCGIYPHGQRLISCRSILEGLEYTDIQIYAYIFVGKKHIQRYWTEAICSEFTITYSNDPHIWNCLLVKIKLLGPKAKFLLELVKGGAPKFAFLVGYRVMLMLLVWKPQFENQ